MQSSRAVRFRFAREGAAQRMVGRDARDRPAFHDCPDIQARATDEDGQAAAPGNVGDGADCQLLVLPECESFVGVDNIDEVMRDTRPFSSRRFGRANIHIAVNLSRVGADDLPAESLRERERERRLAHSGRADNGNEVDALCALLIVRRHAR